MTSPSPAGRVVLRDPYQTNVLARPTPEAATPTSTADLATLARALKQYAPGRGQQPPASNFVKPAMGVITFGEKYFYVPETNSPIVLEPHQKIILNYAFNPAHSFQTIVYSTVKKSGKTTVAALVARWVAENWGSHAEVYCVANDLEQARGRVYQKVLESIELDPDYDRVKRTIPDKWRIIERDATYLPTKSVLRAVSSDYKGEAGSNPTATFWSELWGYTLEASRRLWDELTPVPTRPRSIRFVETYAGFENESDLLVDLYELGTGHRGGTGARQLTLEDMPNWPWPDQPIPCYINPDARLFMYWDQGIEARRMPWHTPEYYKAQAITLRPEAFDRLHLNLWTSSSSAFIPMEWWDRLDITPGNPYGNPSLPPLDRHTPCVLGVDAAVTGDCTGLVLVSRHPTHTDQVVIRHTEVWVPPSASTGAGHMSRASQGLDYSSTIEPAIKALCAKYNVVQIAYDPYQLHKLMSDLRNVGIAWCKPFAQTGERQKADKQLYDLIKDRKLWHYGASHLSLREHIQNAAAKIPKDDDTKLRLVKKTARGKIDLAVATSMAAYECLRLLL